MHFKNIFLGFTMVAFLTLFATSCTPNNTAEEEALYEQNVDKTKIKIPPTGVDKTKIKIPPTG